MSDFIRKITGIGGTNNVNYIPVVYYCVCDTPAMGSSNYIKEAKWYGSSDGNITESATANIELYNGLIVAVLFTKGLGNNTWTTGSDYKLKI